MAKTRTEHTRGQVHGYKHADNGRWYVRFIHGGKREHFSLKVTRRDLAEKAINEINDLLEAGQWGKLRNRTQARHRTFAEATQEYLDKGCRWADSTRRQNKSTVDMLLREFGELAIGDLDAERIEAYLARRRDEGLSKGSRNRYLVCLKVILGKAHEWGFTRFNAAAEVKTEREGRKQPMPYTRDEIDQIFAELLPQHRCIATLYLHTAMRRGELMKLLWSDVDFEARTVAVRAPKNEDDRTIPMSLEVFDILQAHRREWETNRRKTKVVDARVYGEGADIRQVLNRAAIRASIDEGRRHRLQHRLRDTCATTLLDAGVALDRVQVILGHRDIGMTRKYAETRPEALREAIAQTFDAGEAVA